MIQLSFVWKEKYPNKIPIILQSKIGDINNKKILVNKFNTIGAFLIIIRKLISINSSQAIFIMCDNILLSSSATLEDIYNEYKKDDNLLYLWHVRLFYVFYDILMIRCYLREFMML